MTREPATEPTPEAGPETPAPRTIKVLVWDLDNTLWQGTLAEGDDVEIRPGVRDLLETLDQRGILQSIASKNDYQPAMERLQHLGIADYFLYPQISWGAKSSSVETIASNLNLGLNAIAFIDDQPFEREEVRHSLPDVMIFDVSELSGLSDRPELTPRFITNESALRRQMYAADIERNQREESFAGPKEDFLASLRMKLSIGAAQQEDLYRAEELTVRTHQLNTTGYTYSLEELDAFRTSEDHLLLVADLDDRFGTYGKIGLALVETGAERWTVRLLLMSCRVMARGVGTLLMNYILTLARAAGTHLVAEFKSTDRNRMMLVTYKFGGFKEIERRGDLAILEHDLNNIQPFPDYVELELESYESLMGS